MLIAQLLVFILPLGLDTLGVSIALGMKSYDGYPSNGSERRSGLPLWLRSAILFSLAEMTMPVVGLVIGYAVSQVVSGLMHYAGAFLLILVGLWELQEEGREYFGKRKKQQVKTAKEAAPAAQQQNTRFRWRQQLLLALSVSLDELAIGFSLGSVSDGSSRVISPVVFCIFIGIQGFLMAIIGLALGRTLHTRLRALKEWSELLSALLLIGLGTWLLVS